MTVATPIQENARYQSLDMIRGVALFGILLMNITGFGLPFAYGVRRTSAGRPAQTCGRG